MSDSSICDSCGLELQIGQFPFCPHGWAHCHRPFKAYEVDYGEGPKLIDSIQAATRLERESERKARNGEGQQVAFRAFHQDNSNYDCNSFGNHFNYPNRKRTTRRGRPFNPRWR